MSQSSNDTFPTAMHVAAAIELERTLLPAVRFAASQGNFELNVFKPVIAKNVLHSCELLAGTCHAFREFCVEGIQANDRRIEQLLGESLMLVTSLAPLIGYDKASAIAKHAHHKHMTLRDAAIQLGHVDPATFDKLVRAELMVEQG